MHSRDWMEQQLPGLEDQVLWRDFAFVVSIPADFRPGFTNKVNVRLLDHDNYLEFDRRTLTRDTTIGIDISALPKYLDDEFADFHDRVWECLKPFV